MRAFNLLPQERAYATARRPARGPLALVLAALVLLAALASIFLVLDARVSEKRKTEEDLRAEVAKREAEKPRRAVSDDQGPLAAERNARTAALASALERRIPWDRLLRDFSLVLPEDVWLTSLKGEGTAAASQPAGAATPPASDAGGEAQEGESAAAPAPVAPAAAGAGALTVTGYAHDQEGVARLLARLSVVPELASVRLASSESALIRNEEVVAFSITASLDAGQGA